MFVVGSLWYAALATIAPRAYPVSLAFAGAVARFAAVLNAFAFPYASGNPRAQAAAARPATAPLVLQGAVLVVAGYALAPPLAAVVPVAALGALVLGRSIARRLGGRLVGDAYGFIIVVLETGVLVLLSAAGA